MRKEVVGHALVDAQDRDYKNDRWHFSNAYVHSNRITMHQRVKGIGPPGSCIDHYNGCRHDNRRGNLRFVSSSLNGHNKIIDKAAKIGGSSYAGVRKRPLASWAAMFQRVYVGTFEAEADAAWHYNIHAYAKYGPAARLNNVGKPESDSRCVLLGPRPKYPVRRTTLMSCIQNM